eukprot:2564590-Rhodomonas_salina.1
MYVTFTERVSVCPPFPRGSDVCHISREAPPFTRLELGFALYARPVPVGAHLPACCRHVCPPPGGVCPPAGGGLPPVSAPPERNYSRSVA